MKPTSKTKSTALSLKGIMEAERLALQASTEDSARPIPERVRKYEALINQIHPNFCRKLMLRAPGITPMELEVCILTRAFLGVKESAKILSLSASSIHSHRYHARGKLRIGNRETSLISVLHSV